MTKKMNFIIKTLKKIGLKKYDFDDLEDCIAALKDRNSAVRFKAISNVARRHMSKVTDITPFAITMIHDENIDVQLASISVVGEKKTPESAEALKELFRSQEEQLRFRAAWTLCKFEDPLICKFIMDALPSFSPNLREKLQEALKSFDKQPERLSNPTKLKDSSLLKLRNNPENRRKTSPNVFRKTKKEE